MAATQTGTAAPDLHPALLQTVGLLVRPTAGTPVRLETKVLDLEPQPDGAVQLVVAPPADSDPMEHHFDATVAWTYPLGRMECPVTSRPAKRGYGAVWLLRPTALPSRLQERAFFRSRVTVPVRLSWPDESADLPAGPASGEPPTVRLEGVVIDLSEGGLLATVRTAPPEIGQLVEATIRVDGDELTQDARVVRHVRFTGGGSGVGLAFVEPAQHGDRIRQVVFESERRRRRPR